MAGIKDQGPAIGRHLSSSSSRHSGSNRALSHTRRACRAAVTMTAMWRSRSCGEDRNRTGRSRIASAARPLGTCLPVAVPTRIELAYRGRQPRILTRGFRDQMGAPRTRPGGGVCGGNRTLATRFTNSRATITLRTPSNVFREGLKPPSFAHQATALAAVLAEAGSEPGNRTLRMQLVGLRSPPGDLLARYQSERRHTHRASHRSDRRSKPGDRTLHVRRMKPTSPPGELLAAPAGRRGVEPRWSELETNPIPDRSLYVRDSGRTRTAILRFGLSDPGPLDDGVSCAGVVYGIRTRVAGLRARSPGLLEEHDLGARGWDRTSDLRHVTPAFIR
jgi:hypothetical protein